MGDLSTNIWLVYLIELFNLRLEKALDFAFIAFINQTPKIMNKHLRAVLVILSFLSLLLAFTKTGTANGAYFFGYSFGTGTACFLSWLFEED